MGCGRAEVVGALQLLKSSRIDKTLTFYIVTHSPRLPIHSLLLSFDIPRKQD